MEPGEAHARQRRGLRRIPPLSRKRAGHAKRRNTPQCRTSRTFPSQFSIAATVSPLSDSQDLHPLR